MRLKNYFEHVSKERLDEILQKYSYKAITVTLTGDYKKIYDRFIERNSSADRHRGHVVNDCYPGGDMNRKIDPIPYENYVEGIKSRGMDSFISNGPQIIVDTTDFQNVNLEMIVEKITNYREKRMQ